MTQLQKELQAATEAKEQLQTEQERAKKSPGTEESTGRTSL